MENKKPSEPDEEVQEEFNVEVPLKTLYKGGLFVYEDSDLDEKVISSTVYAVSCEKGFPGKSRKWILFKISRLLFHRTLAAFSLRTVHNPSALLNKADGDRHYHNRKKRRDIIITYLTSHNEPA